MQVTSNPHLGIELRNADRKTSRPLSPDSPQPTFLLFCLGAEKLCTFCLFFLYFQMKTTFWMDAAHLCRLKKQK